MKNSLPPKPREQAISSPATHAVQATGENPTAVLPPASEAQLRLNNLADNSPQSRQLKAMGDMMNRGKSDSGYPAWQPKIDPLAKGSHVVPSIIQPKVWSQKKLDGRQTEVIFKTGQLDGDDVGLAMKAFVGPEHKQGGPPKASALKKVMSKLPTDPNFSADEKYVKGHLLNDNIGGEGIAENLFPITAKANGEHERGIEKQVKTWVNDKKQWVYYDVTITPGVLTRAGLASSKLVANAKVFDPSQASPPSTTVTIDSALRTHFKMKNPVVSKPANI